MIGSISVLLHFSPSDTLHCILGQVNNAQCWLDQYGHRSSAKPFEETFQSFINCSGCRLNKYIGSSPEDTLTWMIIQHMQTDNEVTHESACIHSNGIMQVPSGRISQQVLYLCYHVFVSCVDVPVYAMVQFTITVHNNSCYIIPSDSRGLWPPTAYC